MPPVFDFFSNAENLQSITPNNLKFMIKTPLPIIMKEGLIIDYNLRIRGISMNWSSLISTYNPPYNFVDEQIIGPYKMWHHTHTFIEKNKGTYIVDDIRYSLPFGFIGQMAHSLFVRRDLESIFIYRKKSINELIRG